MNATTNNDVQVVMISVECSMFGGYKRSNEQDIVDAGGKVPDTDILTKGGKHIFPSERLATFGTIKKGVFRDLWKFGIKALGSGSVIAIDANELPAAERILEDAEKQFSACLDDLKRNYDKWLDEFIQDQPNAAAGDIIRRAALTKEDATSRFKFSYDTFMPTPVGKTGTVESMAAKLTSQLYREVAQAAYETWDKSFHHVSDKANGQRTRRKVGQKTKSPLRNCRDKLNKLAFLDPNVTGAVTIIDTVLATTPVTGWIEDTPDNPADTRLYGLVTLMMEASKFAKAAEDIMRSSDVAADVDAMCGIVEAEIASNEVDLFAEKDGDVWGTPVVSPVAPVQVPVSPIVVAQAAQSAMNFESNFF